MDADVKERLFLLLVLKVEGDDIHSSSPCCQGSIEVIRTWASAWLARYREEGIEGQRDRPKSGRPPELSQEVVLRIRKKIKESRQGWTTKQVDGMMIVKEGGGMRYHSHHHHHHIYRLLHKWGIQAEGTKEDTCQHRI
jgi:transposase